MKREERIVRNGMDLWHYDQGVKDERERCAKIAEGRIVNDAYPFGRRLTPDEIAAEIRATTPRAAFWQDAE